MKGNPFHVMHAQYVAKSIEAHISALTGKSFGSNDPKLKKEHVARRRDLQISREFRAATKEVWDL